LHAVVNGDVQGVGFRWFITRTARDLGLRGWVRNRPDGTVELTAEGGRAELEKLLSAARQGPRHAHVSSVDAHWSAASGGLEAFDLTY
jgi:acylphosphatase